MKSFKPRPYKEVPETLGEHLKKRRMLLGLYQKEVATRVGVDEWTYINWEHDRTKPALRYLPDVINFLDYDPFGAPDGLGEQIKSKRRRLRMSQGELASRLGIDAGSIRKAERGLKPIERIRSKLEAWLADSGGPTHPAVAIEPSRSCDFVKRGRRCKGTQRGSSMRR